jgi:hypothetical protein
MIRSVQAEGSVDDQYQCPFLLDPHLNPALHYSCPTMSSFPHHGGPRQYSYNYLDTSYGVYTNWGQHASTEGMINNIVNSQTTNYLHNSLDPLRMSLGSLLIPVS